MGNAVSAKAADERAALKRQQKKEKREKRRRRHLMQQKLKFDESGNPLHYDKQGNQFYYDNKGNPYYVDEAGTRFYLDDHGAIFYLNENEEPYYLDENGEKFYLDENREPYYLDKKGEKYFLDTEGNKYYFDENGNPYLADEKSVTDKEDILSDKFKERRMGVISTQSSRSTDSQLFNEKEMQIRSPITPSTVETAASQRTVQVIDHRRNLFTSTKFKTPQTAESRRTVEVLDHRKNSLTSSRFTTPQTVESQESETESLLSSYKSLSFTKSEYEPVIPHTPDYIKDDSKESETQVTAQIEAENKVLKKLLQNERERKVLPESKAFCKVGTFNIQAEDDTKDCLVSGQAFLPNGNLIIADVSNRKLKLFDSELEIVTSHTLEFRPHGLCTGSKDKLAHVTFKTTMFNGIGIFKVEDKTISSQQTVRMKGVPYGIARSNEGLAVMVSNPNGWQIHLTNLKGQISRVIDLENNDLKLVNPEYLAITKDLKLFVSDRSNNSVYCFDTKGEELFQYNQLREPRGLCIDNKGSVFITSPGVVHQVSTSGERIKALMRRETTGFAPTGVCYDSEDSLMVLTGQSNFLIAYELT